MRPDAGTLKRNLWRHVLYWRFRLFQAGRQNRVVVERVAGRAMFVLPTVFNPRVFRTGEFLAKALDARLIPPGSAVLDMGTGSGVGALFAARWAAQVVAVDINPMAVHCARINAWLHQVEHKIRVMEGDLFEPVSGEMFDVVLFNPPFFRGTPRDDRERALWSMNVDSDFAAGLQTHLAPGGHALVVLSSDGDYDAFLDTFQSHGWCADLVVEKDLISETVWMYRLRRRQDVDPL